jgi:hypothetical protein
MVCGTCRTQRVRDLDGQVSIYPYEQAPAHHPGAVIPGHCNTCGGPCRAPQVSGEPIVLHEHAGPAEPLPGARLAIVAGPAEGSPEWWAAATRDDLEPGWWGQPDLPELPAGKVCTECRLPWPAPDGSGLCRYCRLARAEQAGAPEAATGPGWGASRRIDPIPLQPKTITRRRCAPGDHRAVRRHAASGAFLPVYLIGCALFVGPGSPGFFLFLGLFMALMSYRALRK